MRRFLAVPLLAACTTAPSSGRWRAMLVNGGGSDEVNYASHRDHLDLYTDALMARGWSRDQIQVLASDGADPTPDLVSVAKKPDRGDVPDWAVGAGPLFDEGGPLAHLWPAPELVDTNWTRTAVGPATADALAGAVRDAALRPGDTLLLYTTDHGELDGSLSLWNESLPPDAIESVLRPLPEGARALVVMSQCHSGAFARPLLALRQSGMDVCGSFSVPEDRQATGCFPERDGAPIGHGFRAGEALARSADFEAMHHHLLLADQGPDVPLRTSDVYLWERLVEESERRGEDVVDTVDRLLAQSDPAVEAETRAIVAQLASRAGIAPPERLSQLVTHTEQWTEAIGQASWKVDDLAWVRADAVLRVQQVAMERAPAEEAPDWPTILRASADEAGLADTLPALDAAYTAAEAELWRWTVREALVARMGWLLSRIAGRELVASDPALDALLACERTPLSGTVPPAPGLPDWAVEGPAPSVAAVPWVGVRLEPDQQGRPVVLAVHPDSPARGTLVPGARIRSVDGAATPTIESVVSRFALAAVDRPLQVDVGTGPQPVVPMAWPELLLPAVVPIEGNPAPAVLDWVTRPPAGAHLIVWTGGQCPSCEAALARARGWAARTGHQVVHIDDGMSSGLPGARIDHGGWTADAFAIDLIPSMVAVDAVGRITWRVDGWLPEEGIDLPEPPGAVVDLERFPRGPSPAADAARGTPAP